MTWKAKKQDRRYSPQHRTRLQTAESEETAARKWLQAYERRHN